MAWTPRAPRIDYGPEDAVRELGTLVLQMVSQERMAAREEEEREKDRSWQESQTYITANLTELSRVRVEEDALRKEARDLGVLDVALKEISDVDITAASMEITKDKGDRLLPAIEAVGRISTKLEQNISGFHRGTKMAKVLDTSSDGTIQLEEMSAWIKEQQKIKGKEWKPSDAFMLGVTDYTYDPERRVGLEIAEIDKDTKALVFQYLGPEYVQKLELGELSKAEALQRIETEKLAAEQAQLQIDYQTIINENLPREIALKFEKLELDVDQMGELVTEAQLRNQVLPTILKDEAKLREISIETGELSNAGLIEENKNRKIAGSTAILGMEKTKKELELYDISIASGNFELDKNLREEVMANVEKSMVDNVQYQADIGASILTHMSVLDDEGMLVPLSVVFNTMSIDPAAGIDMISELDEDKYDLIQGDIRRLLGSIQLGKTEDLLADYSLFLKEVGKIKGFENEYQSFVKNNIGLIEEYQTKHNITPPSTAPFLATEAIIGTAELQHPLVLGAVNPLNIEKAIQWANTGIFDEMSLIESAIETVGQRTDLNKTRDLVRNLDLGSTMKARVNQEPGGDIKPEEIAEIFNKALGTTLSTPYKYASGDSSTRGSKAWFESRIDMMKKRGMNPYAKSGPLKKYNEQMKALIGDKYIPGKGWKK